MSDSLKLGLVIGGAVSATVGKAFKDVESRIKALDDKGAKARVLQSTIGETIKLREEWRKAHATGQAGATALLSRLNSNLDSLKAQGVEVGRLSKAYKEMGRTARSAELQAKGRRQMSEGRETVKSSVGQAVVAAGALAIPTKVSADFGAIVRDIAIKAGIANKPQEAEMSRTIITTARDTGMERNQVADVVNQLVGAGMELSKALEYAPVAAKFVVGQGSEGTDTAKMINALGQNAKITDAKEMQQALEAIAYQGQAGSFEASDMAKWFPELLANMGSIGITGMDAVTQLGAMLQVQMKTAGSSDEAANNLKNWMGKIGASDTVDAYKKAGIDYEGSMQTGLQKGMSTLESSMALAQQYIQKTDPKKAEAMAAATAKISKETDPAKAKAMMESLSQALKTGDIFADMQVKAALTAYLQNKQLYNDLKSQSRNASGILDKNLAERREGSSQKWAELSQAANDAMRSVGDAIRPATDAVAQGLTTVAQGITTVSDKMPNLAMGLTGTIGALLVAKSVFGAFKIGKGLMNLARGSVGGGAGKVQQVFVTNAKAAGVGSTAAAAPGAAASGRKARVAALLGVGLTVASKAGAKLVDKDKPDDAKGDDAKDEEAKSADADGEAKRPKGLLGVGFTALEAYRETLEAGADSDGGSNASGEGGGLQRVFVVNASEIGAGSGLPGQRDTPRRGRRSARARRRAGAASRPPVVSPRPTGEPRTRPVPPRPVGEPRIRPVPPSPPGEPRIRPVPPSPADAPRIHPVPRLPIPVPPLPAAAERSIMPLLGKMAGKAKVLPGEAVISAGLKAVELYQSDDPIEKKLEGATEVAGSALGGWGGAAAGAAIGTMILPVVGTAIGAAIGGALGSWGGSEVGGILGKELFGSPEKENKPVSLLAAPPVPVALPGPVVPTLGATAKAFGNDRVPLMARGPAPALAPTGPVMGDVGRAMTEKPAVSPAAPIVIKPEATKMPTPKYEQQVSINAPITLTVQGDVKDPQQLMRDLEPMIQRAMRDSAQQSQRSNLFDAPHVE
ncbi:Prophage PSPPH06, putative tail tape measure domain protein [Pseudomonas savastanoi pv. glycinea]|uniref:Tail tape measure protein n=1 Tax=Pseudomonas savastanoi pv. glycinea TaxID=318 RepID=A0AB74B327_PSESG|nr:phage tail tape measure protein [Pseudomonas savastanoi]KPX42350.1 Prophage PSPPH06, putative tail tape measure domain protein [Pseudomonas savastanoi pv. glycinea]PYD20503.1 phage tail tape measure protein [Pseudomonas savastanoi pv. glycinea]RMM77742.1 Tail tape measure protein [Pseudomonas savastanoi pv. glycinea]RMP50213.1 Tail tape measure protein [Pseudomonas savastanoi pv. glycinea]RMP91571.1 Prophage PSPPH06, putative tail tape measure domain protein [Pseudomonas savastanoi pv. glyc